MDAMDPLTCEGTIRAIPTTERSAATGLYMLMDRYIEGDKAAFAALHAALDPRLRSFLRRIVRDSAAADDLAQATWLRAHLARERFEARGPRVDGAVLAWYFTIARNLALDHIRARARARVHAGLRDDVADEMPTVEEERVSREEAHALKTRLDAALARLPEGQREIVEMHKLRELTMAEVAARLRIREGTARVRAHRAYVALARCFGPMPRVISVLLAFVGAAIG